MPSGLLAVQISLVLVLSGSAFLAGSAVLRGRFHPLNIATVVHSGFAVAPILLEWLWGIPTYKVFTHMLTVNDSRATTLIYSAFTAAVSATFLLIAHFDHRRCGSGRRRYVTWSEWKASQRLSRSVLWMGLLLPVLLALYADDPSLWLTYGAVLDSASYAESEVFANALYWSTYISVLSGCGLLIRGRRNLFVHIAIFLLLIAALWLNGKRNIVVLAALLVMISLRIAGLTSKRVSYALVFGAVILFVGYSQWYQTQLRPTLSAYDTSYEMARMDFGRDSDTRIAIFSEVEPGARPVLESRGQSVIFDLFFFVPRSVWPEKPRPYYHYITAVALKSPLILRPWGITTTVLSEAIANFGISGFVAGPLFVIAIGVFGYRPSSPFVTLLTSLICTLFLSIHLAGFGVLWLIWCVLTVHEQWSEIRSNRRESYLSMKAAAVNDAV